MGRKEYTVEAPEQRTAFMLDAEQFRRAGHKLVDELAAFYASLDKRPVTRGEAVETIRKLIGEGGLPSKGTAAEELLGEIVPLLCEHSLHNGHPRFFGYITSSAAPLGALADLLAAAVNPNLGLWSLSPVASEIETQTVRWLAELIGFPVPCGGIMVSGGNMANFLAFVAARKAKTPWDIRAEGLCADSRRLRVYASRGTHTWIEKASDLVGLGNANIRWIAMDDDQRVRIEDLERSIREDRDAGDLPFLVVGTAGSVSTGTVDPLGRIAELAREYGLWFHVDGAYGAPAAMLPEAPSDLKALKEADSVALDPHKWLYNPLEAACTLVRDPHALRDAFSYLPPYYRSTAAAGLDYHEQGFQNSRGFRALKVWLSLRHVGRSGYEQMLREDIALSRHLFDLVSAHAELEPGTQQLSITTFRYRPADADTTQPQWREYLNLLNEQLLQELQRGGEAYVSNAVLNGRIFLRACIVNFRTTSTDIEALVEIVARTGRKLDSALRPAALARSDVT